MTGLGLPSASEQTAYEAAARDAVTGLAMASPAERPDMASAVLAGYVGQPHADVRCDILSEALDAFAGGDPEDALLTKAQWNVITKAFRKTLAASEKSERKDRYQAAVTKEAELSEAAFVDRAVTDALEGDYVYATGFGWMRYNGRHWAAVDVQAVRESVRQYTVDTVAELLQQKVRDPKELMGMLKKTFVGNIVALAEGVLMIEGECFDANPDLLNVANGTVDLRTGELRPHRGEDYFTKMAPTDYVPGATSDAWTQALSSMDSETAGWMQLRYGNGVTGHPSDDHRMCFLNGSGGNGKSMHLDGISNTLGTGKSGYFSALSDGALVAKDPDKEAQMSLRGARVAVIEELPEGRHLNVVSLKRFLGTKNVTGRHLYQKEVTFQVSHSLFVTSNYDLSVGETDDGTWRRLAKVPFPFSYVDEPEQPHERLKDLTLAARLEEPEARRAALAWLVEGAVRWYREGLTDLNMPAPVRAATDQWRGDSDMVLRFFDEFLVKDSEHHIASSDMLKAFNGFLEDQSQSTWSVKTLTSRFKDHTRIRKNGVETARIRPGGDRFPIASRKPSSSYGMDSLPGQYAAWTGVRFRTEADDMPEPVADPIPASGVLPSNVVAFPSGRDFDTESSELWAAADFPAGEDPWA